MIFFNIVNGWLRTRIENLEVNVRHNLIKMNSNSTVLGLSWKADSYAAGQKISRFSRTRMFITMSSKVRTWTL